MALAGNTGGHPAPNSLCASPDACGSHPNTKTCRGNPYTYPADGYASPTFADASANRYATGHTNRHIAAYTDKHARANGHAGVDIGISEMDGQPDN